MQNKKLLNLRICVIFESNRRISSNKLYGITAEAVTHLKQWNKLYEQSYVVTQLLTLRTEKANNKRAQQCSVIVNHYAEKENIWILWTSI
jgi:hypothetical protein